MPWTVAPDSSVHGDTPGKNTGVACHALLQRIFPTQGSNPHYRQILYCLSHTIKKIYGGGLVAKSCLTLCNPIVACQAPLSMGFSRQEYWSGLPFPSPGDLPHPGIEPRSPALQADAFTIWATREAVYCPEREAIFPSHFNRAQVLTHFKLKWVWLFSA